MPGEFYIEGKKDSVDITDIKNIISEIQTTVINMQSDISEIVSGGQGGGAPVICADFWSGMSGDSQVEIGAGAESKYMPAVTVDRLPEVAEVLAATAMFKFRMIDNSNGNENRLNGGTVPGISQVIQVRKTPDGEWGDAISLADSEYRVEGETREGGDVRFGDTDVSEIVDSNGVYELQWLLARSLLNYMHFWDVQMGIRVWYQASSQPQA